MDVFGEEICIYKTSGYTDAVLYTVSVQVSVIKRRKENISDEHRAEILWTLLAKHVHNRAVHNRDKKRGSVESAVLVTAIVHHPAKSGKRISPPCHDVSWRTVLVPRHAIACGVSRYIATRLRAQLDRTTIDARSLLS